MAEQDRTDVRGCLIVLVLWWLVIMVAVMVWLVDDLAGRIKALESEAKPAITKGETDEPT